MRVWDMVVYKGEVCQIMVELDDERVYIFGDTIDLLVYKHQLYSIH